MNSNDTTSLRSPKQDQCKYVSVDKGTVSECSWSMAKSNAVAPSTLARFRSAPAAFRNSKAWLWRFISGCFKTKKHRIQEIHQFIINLHQSWKYLKIFHRPFSNFTIWTRIIWRIWQSFPCLCLAIGGSNKNWSKTQSLIASIRQCQSWSSCGLRLKGVAPAANGGAGEGFTALEKNLFLGPGALMSAPLSTSHFKFLATLEFWSHRSPSPWI